MLEQLERPEIRSEPQHMRALEQANRVRLARAELKRRVAAGELAVAEVILQCPWEAETMSVSDVLMSQHRWGRTRARRLLSAQMVSETKQVGSLTARQRMGLVAALSESAGERG
jgi:hypothetical protein